MSTIKLNTALLAVGLGLLLSNSFIVAAYAQAFSGRGIPSRREGAGTRGCTLESRQPSPVGGTIVGNRKSSSNLVALIPKSNIGATLAAYLTFFWYVPLLPSANKFIPLKSWALDKWFPDG